MSQSPQSKPWLSAYISFQGDIYDTTCDHLLLSVVLPVIDVCRRRRWIGQYFFIRYTDHRGPHIRLRLAGFPVELRDQIRLHVETTITQMTDQLHEAHPLWPARPLQVQWVPYEPEVNRYGGPAGVTVAETFFHYSSDIACALLPQIVNKGEGTRLGKALLLMTIMVYVFLPDRMQATAFLKDYSTGYLRARIKDEALQSTWLERFNQGYDRQSDVLATYVNEVWQRLETAVPLSDTLDRFYADMRRIKEQLGQLVVAGKLVKNEITLSEWQNGVRLIIPSYLHMMNNRLGVSIENEVYLAYLMDQTLAPPVVTR